MIRRFVCFSLLSLAIIGSITARADCTAVPTATLSDHGATLHLQATGGGSCGSQWAQTTTISSRIDNAGFTVLQTCPTPQCVTADFPQGLGCLTDGSHTFEIQVDCYKPNPSGADGCVPDTTKTASTTFNVTHRAVPSTAFTLPVAGNSYEYKTTVDYEGSDHSDVHVHYEWLPTRTLTGGGAADNGPDIDGNAHGFVGNVGHVMSVVAYTCDASGKGHVSAPADPGQTLSEISRRFTMWLRPGMTGCSHMTI